MGWTRQFGPRRPRPSPDLTGSTGNSPAALDQLGRPCSPSPDLNSGRVDELMIRSFKRLGGPVPKFHVDGTGQSVAVIDTGVNYNQRGPRLGVRGGSQGRRRGRFHGQPEWCPPLLAARDAASPASSARATPANPGVAPGVDIVALRVFGDNNQGSFTAIADALELGRRRTTPCINITAVNLSISDGGNNYLSNDLRQRTDGVGPADHLGGRPARRARTSRWSSAAGNSFDGKTQGLGFPSIVPDAISVTATDARRRSRLASTAQRLGTAKGGRLGREDRGARAWGSPPPATAQQLHDRGRHQLRRPAGHRQHRPAPADVRGRLITPCPRSPSSTSSSRKAP